MPEARLLTVLSEDRRHILRRLHTGGAANHQRGLRLLCQSCTLPGMHILRRRRLMCIVERRSTRRHDTRSTHKH